jgi:hypothetical protein
METYNRTGLSSSESRLENRDVLQTQLVQLEPMDLDFSFGADLVCDQKVTDILPLVSLELDHQSKFRVSDNGSIRRESLSSR